MRLLLDTQAFLWFIDGDPHLSNDALTSIQDASNDKFVSIASDWEVAIKVSKKKLTLAHPVEVVFPRELQKNGFGLLEIGWNHLAQVCQLPWHHKDPFDRLLVAQAIGDGMEVVGNDAAFDGYGVSRIW